MNEGRLSNQTPMNGNQGTWMHQLPGGLRGSLLPEENSYQQVSTTPSGIFHLRDDYQDGSLSTFDEENYLRYGVADPNEVFQHSDDVNDLLANVNDPYPLEESLDFGSYLDDTRSPCPSEATSGYGSASYLPVDAYGQPISPSHYASGHNSSHCSQNQTHLSSSFGNPSSSNETLGIGLRQPGDPSCDQSRYSSIHYPSDQTVTTPTTFSSYPPIVYPPVTSNVISEDTGNNQQSAPFQLPAEPSSFPINGSSSTALKKAPKHRHQRVYGLPEDEQKDRTRELNKEASKLYRQKKKKEAKEAEAREVEERQRKMMELYKQLQKKN